MWRYRLSPSNVSTPSEAARLLGRPTDAIRVPEGHFIGAAGALRLRLQTASEQRYCEYAVSPSTLSRRARYGTPSWACDRWHVEAALVVRVAQRRMALPRRHLCLPRRMRSRSAYSSLHRRSRCAPVAVFGLGSLGYLVARLLTFTQATSAPTRIFHLSILRSKAPGLLPMVSNDHERSSELRFSPQSRARPSGVRQDRCLRGGASQSCRWSWRIAAPARSFGGHEREVA